MKNSNKKSQKKSIKKQFKINWKIVIIAGCFCVGLGIGFGIKAIVKNVKSKTLDVAFLDLPDQISAELESQIKLVYQGKINFVDIEKSAFNKNDVKKKYDILFSWENEFTNSLKSDASFVPSECGSNMPESIFAHRTTSVPLLLDHFQIAFNDTVRHKVRIRYPGNIEQFETYLNWIKKEVEYPFYCAGGDDETLYALLTCFVESYGGTDGYEKFIQILQNQKNLKDVIDVNLNGDSKNAYTLHNVLDILRGWQEEKLLPENWIASKNSDVRNFILDDYIGVLFSSLSYYRTLPYNKASQFASDRFPVANMAASHSLIAPAVIGMKLTKNERFDSVFTTLTDTDVQTELSMSTTYAPVASYARVYDRQADDVRFLAAACAGGPKPIAGNVMNKEAYDSMIHQIRYYIKTGIIINE